MPFPSAECRAFLAVIRDHLAARHRTVRQTLVDDDMTTGASFFYTNDRQGGYLKISVVQVSQAEYEIAADRTRHLATRRTR